MDGISAFVNGLHLAIMGLALGIIGIILMSVSVTFYFSLKQVRLSTLILTAAGTVSLLSAVCIYSKGSPASSIGVVIGIFFSAIILLILFYDVMVIRKFIKQKNKPTEEQNGKR